MEKKTKHKLLLSNIRQMLTVHVLVVKGDYISMLH